MLLMAMRGLLREPAPYVLRQALGDAPAECILRQCNRNYRLYSELHLNVFDVFNEYSVQIMTSSRMDDPAEPSRSKDKRFAKSAK
jgi:hypothetical protein